MRVFLSKQGHPTCYHCRYCLDGLPSRGQCPECGQRYNTSLLQVSPGVRRGLLYLRALALYLLRTFRPSFWAVAVWWVVLGNAVLLIIVALAATRWLRVWY